jgi:large subunit ribosomal protein L17
MKKRSQGRTLSRNATQRKALRRTMLTSLVSSGSIKTTIAKAKELKPFAERMITRAKKVKDGDKGSLVVVVRQLKKDVTTDTAKKIIELAKKYKNRQGGYLRIVKLVPRKSDTAEMAILQWVGSTKDSDLKSDDEKKISTKGNEKDSQNVVDEKGKKSKIVKKVKAIKKSKKVK